MLRWHYRSRHPSLIEVSNAEFYGSNLFLPPAPSAARSAEGLIFRRVPGAYDRGGKRTNAIEAQAIVDAVARHAAETRELTLGVVTFSTAQRDLVSNLLDERRRSDPLLDRLLRPGVEEVFVKNLENVQGDERDIILIRLWPAPSRGQARQHELRACFIRGWREKAERPLHAGSSPVRDLRLLRFRGHRSRSSHR